jgi:hypothetical protein
MVAIKAMKKLDIIQSKHVDHIENEKKILEIMVHPFVVSKTHLKSSQYLNLLDAIFRVHAR